MKRMLPAVIAVVVVVAAGVVHGFWTNRWHTSKAIETAVANLDRVPRVVGDWKAEPVRSDLSDKKALPGQLYLRYRNGKTGESILVALVCGRHGPVSEHTPDVCYGASGFKVGRATPFVPPGCKDARFFTTEVEHNSAAGQTKQRVFWSWFGSGRWQTPNNPRVEFVMLPVLYKLWLVHDMVTDRPVEQDPCADFLRQFLPALQKALEPGTV